MNMAINMLHNQKMYQEYIKDFDIHDFAAVNWIARILYTTR